MRVACRHCSGSAQAVSGVLQLLQLLFCCGSEIASCLLCRRNVTFLFEFCCDLTMQGCLAKACLRRLLIPLHQRPDMRLPVLCQPSVKIAFFLIMVEQFSLLVCSRLHFLSQILKLLCQSIMILI